MSEIYTQQVNVPTFGMVSINFFGLSSKVIDLYNITNEFSRQRYIKHLGLISNVFDSVSHTRFDYLMLQCMMVDIFDKFHTGDSIYNLGSIKIYGNSCTGNEILKSWFLLSNFGHAKNTLADEKALCYRLINDKEKRRVIISKIKDNDLKKYSRKVITSFDYMNMHYVLGIARVYEEVNSTKLKRVLIDLYKALLLDKDQVNGITNFSKLTNLREIYKTIRKLAIISIDSHYSHVPFSINILSTIINLQEKDSYESDFLNSILGALNKELYLNREVLCIQQAYIFEALEELDQDDDFSGLISKKIFKDGIIKEVNSNLKVITRLTLKENMQIYEDLITYKNRLIDRIDNPDILINVDKNLYLKEIYIDFFVVNSEYMNQLPRVLHSIMRYIETTFEDMLTYNNVDSINFFSEIENLKEAANLTNESTQYIKDNLLEPIFHNSVSIYRKEILNLFEQVFWDVINYFIKPNYKIVVNKNISGFSHFDTIMLNERLNSKDNLTNALNIFQSNADRLHEINHLVYGLKRKYDGYSLYLIERATVFNLSLSPEKRTVTDIDSLIMKIRENEIIIEFNESKNTSRPERDGVKDIRKKFVKILNSSAKGYRTREVLKFGAKVVLKIKI